MSSPPGGVRLSAQGGEHLLKCQRRRVQAGGVQGGQLLRRAPDGVQPAPSDVLGGENRQLPTGGFHLVRGTGDSTELLQQRICGAVLQDAALVQDQDLLEEGGGLADDVGGQDEGAPGVGG